MSSRNGMARASIDTGLLHDRKVVALARRYRDEPSTSVALVLYLSAVLASWREDRPMGVVESAPAWMLVDPEPVVAELRAVGLVDDDGLIPAATLDVWMAEVRGRTAAARAAAEARWSNAAAMPPHSGRNAAAMLTERETEREREPSRGRARRPASSSGSAAPTTPPVPLKDVIGSFDDIVKPKGGKT